MLLHASKTRRNGRHRVPKPPLTLPLEEREETKPTRRPRYVSKNCHTLRRLGPDKVYLRSATGRHVLSTRRRVPHPSTEINTYIPGEHDSDVESEDDLELELLKMQTQVEALRRTRDLADTRTLNAHAHAVSHAMAVTDKFYQLFGHGYNPDRYPQASRSSAGFLRSVMHPDVVCSDFRGVDLFLKQYEMCTHGHESWRLEMTDIEVLQADSAQSLEAPSEDVSHNDWTALWTGTEKGHVVIKAKAYAVFRVNRTTLENLFPGIIADENLTQDLVGKEYVMQYDKIFHFKNGKIFMHESYVDFCASLLKMVQDPMSTMKLLQHSIMTKNGHLKIEEVEEDKNELHNRVM